MKINKVILSYRVIAECEHCQKELVFMDQDHYTTHQGGLCPMTLNETDTVTCCGLIHSVLGTLKIQKVTKPVTLVPDSFYKIRFGQKSGLEVAYYTGGLRWKMVGSDTQYTTPQIHWISPKPLNLGDTS